MVCARRTTCKNYVIDAIVDAVFLQLHDCCVDVVVAVVVVSLLLPSLLLKILK